MTSIEGAICDLDGTLVESEELHLEAWNELLRRAGHEPPSPRWNDDCIGLPDTYAAAKTLRFFPDMGDVGDINNKKQVIFRELVREKGVALAYPGVRDMLARLREDGFPLAVGTNSILANTRASLDAAGLSGFFDVVVTLDQVENGKPAPDIYLEAAKRLGLAPGRCAVLEDSLAGIEAARRAGCLVLGIASTWAADRLGDADRIFDSTAGALGWIRDRRRAT